VSCVHGPQIDVSGGIYLIKMHIAAQGLSPSKFGSPNIERPLPTGFGADVHVLVGGFSEIRSRQALSSKSHLNMRTTVLYTLRCV